MPSPSISPAADELHRMVDDNLQKILDELGDTIDEIESRNDQDNKSRIDLDQLKDITYDTEDVIADFHNLLLQQHYPLISQSDLDILVRRTRRILGKNEVLGDLRRSVDFRGLIRARRLVAEEQGTSSLSAIPFEECNRRSVVERFVSRRLLLSPSSLSSKAVVFPIYGPAGAGKTIFAQHVFNHPTAVKMYDKRAWVYIYQTCPSEVSAGHRNRGFDHDKTKSCSGCFRELLTDTYQAIAEKSCNATDPGEIQRMLGSELEGKRFLLVLDNAWKKEDGFWGRFWNNLLGSIGKEGSVAIVTTRDYSVVREMADEENLLSIPALKKDTSPNFRSSYRGLPPPLKRCVAYCTLFPPSYDFKKDFLVRLWVAEGLVCSKNGKDLEELASAYFEQLVDNSFFEPSRDIYNQYTMGKLSDFLQRINSKCSRIEDGKTSSKIAAVRHLSYVASDLNKDIPWSSVDVANLRTFLVAPVKGFDGKVQVDVSVLFRMKHMRVLDLSFSNIVEVPESIGKLKLLRYLCLMGTGVETLPDTICSLCYLQTLDLSFSNIRKLPGSVCKLCNLQTLNLSFSNIRKLPGSVCKLCNLQTLDLSFSNIRKLPGSVCKLCNLQVLDLNYSELEELPQLIGKLGKLRFLGLNKTKIRTLPESVSNLHSLEKLEIEDCKRLEGLPRNIKQLCHIDLVMGNISFFLPSGIGMFTALEKLPAFYVGRTDGCGNLEELKNLGNLTQLGIFGLCNVTHIRMPGLLENKEKLRKLSLMWPLKKAYPDYDELSDDDFTDFVDEEFHEIPNSEDDDEETSFSDMLTNDSIDANAYSGNLDIDFPDPAQGKVTESSLLKSLTPHVNLEELTIKSYDGSSFPEWIGSTSFSKLKSVRLEDCEMCEKLPSFGSLPSLQYFTIDNLPIKCIGREFCFHQGDEVGFQSLQALSFKNMYEWKRWSKVEDDFPVLQQVNIFNCPELTEIPYFPSKMLQEVTVFDCPKLRKVPCFPFLNTLKVECCGIEALVDLPSLKSLWLTACDALTTFPSFQKLEESTIMFCESLNSLPPLPSLQNLWVEDCEQLTSIDALDRFHGNLIVLNCPRLVLSLGENVP